MGACCWLVIGFPVTRVLRDGLPDFAHANWLDWSLGLYVTWLVIGYLKPLDLTLSPHALWNKFKLGAISPIPFADLGPGAVTVSQLAWDAALFVPVGAFLALWNLPKPRQPRSWRRCLTLGFLLAAALETAQVFVYSRWASSTDVITALIGISLGAGLSRWIVEFAKENRSSVAQ